MTDLIYEPDYAREMLFTAIRCQTDGRPAATESVSAEEISALIDRAVEVGCGRNQLIVELAIAAARLFTQSAPQDANAREVVDGVSC
jgi:hypothetical protein